jgi:hypothetical protein
LSLNHGLWEVREGFSELCTLFDRGLLDFVQRLG